MMSSPIPVRRKAKVSSSQNIKVFVRCRPMNSQEKAGKSYNIVGVQNGREVVVKERPTDKFAKTFTFDHVFGPDSKQIDVYKAVAKNSVDEVLNGFNCTIFAYGQTGTGKTFTMEGERAPDSPSWEEDPLAGIIPRCVNHLFDELRMQKVEFTMRVSFLELYNEELFDLLSAHDDMSKLRLYEDATKKGSCIIQGLEEVLVRSKSDVYSIMEKGSTKRQTAATLMNAHSSRSHTVFTVTVHMKENTLDGDELLKTGKLHLVDLAGSENIGRSGAVEKRAREAGNINMSLLTLGRVITALVEKGPHIPYRESKLTRLLQDALGGRTKTSVIATISPASINQEETLSTLDYAHRAKNIQNKPEVNQKLNKKELIGEYSHEIERLRRDLMAMREKSGVYLANENYQEMLSTMEAQAQEITEKIGHIRTLETEVEKKTELFTQVTQQLETTSQELANTQEKLSTTRNTLSCTQRLLHTTAQEREEQRYLVDAHARTEEKLHTEGQSLINVATSTSCDLSRLHDKLDRKRNVESKNSEAFQNFQDSYTAFQDILRQDLVSTLARHTEALHTASSQHCESVRQCRGVVANTSGALTALGEKQAALTTTALNLVKKMVEVLLGGVKEAREEAQTDSAHQREALCSLLATENEILDQLASLISASSTSIASLHSALNEKLQHMESGCDGLQQHLSSFTTQLLEEVDARHNALLRRTDVCSASLTSHLASTQTHTQSLTTNIESLLSTLTAMKEEVAGFTTTSQEQVSATQHNISLLKEEAQQGTDRVTAITRQGRDHGTSLLADIRTQTVETRTQLDERVNELEGTMQRVGEKRCEAETALEQHTGKIQQALDTTTASQDRHVSSLEKGTAGHLKSVQEEMEAGHNTMKEALSGHSHNLQQEAEGLDRAQRQLTEGLEGAEAGIKEWGVELDNNLQTQTSRVMALFTQDIMEDKPTGQTPVRREYTFPNSLPATSPHERLLLRFRSSSNSTLYPSRIPLPSLGDDTEDDLGDNSTLSAASSDSPHMTLNDDDPVTEDSVISSRSRSGSVSSLKENGSSQFAVPRPPLQREDSGIPLSRSSSSSSITEGKENHRGTRQNSSNSKKRELKQPSVYKSTSLEKLPGNTASATASEGRTRRILGAQN